MAMTSHNGRVEASTVDVGNALEAARALGAALGLLGPGRFGEITVQFGNGQVALLRKGQVLKPDDLATIPVVVDE